MILMGGRCLTEKRQSSMKNLLDHEKLEMCTGDDESVLSKTV